METTLSKRNIQTLHNILTRNRPGYVVVNKKRVRIHPKDITDEKTGGILPLAALIPIIAGAIGATGGLAGGVSAAVNAGNTRAHQMAMEKIAQEKGVNMGKGYESSSEEEINQAIEVLRQAGYTVLRV